MTSLPDVCENFYIAEYLGVKNKKLVSETTMKQADTNIWEGLGVKTRFKGKC